MSIKFEKIEQNKITIIAIVISVLIGLSSVYFSEYTWVLFLDSLFILLAIFKFEIALCFTLFVFPLIPRYFGVDLGHGLPIINVQRILLGSIYLGWIFRKAISGGRFSKPPLCKLILILFLIQGLSIFRSADKHAALLSLFYYLFECYLLFYIIFDVIRTKEQIRKVIVVIIIAAGIVGIIGLTEYISGQNLYSSIKPVRELMSSAMNIQTREEARRVEVSFGHAISCGMYLILVIPISFFLLACAKSRFMKATMWIFSLILLIVLYLTLSRGPWLGLIVAVMWVLLIVRQDTKYRKMVLMIGLLVCLFFMQPFFLQREIHKVKTIIRISLTPSVYWYSGQSEVASSITGRVIALKEAMIAFSKRPIGGYGLACSAPEITGVRADINYYMELLLESGIFALLLFGLILIKIFRVLWNCSKKAKEKEDKMLVTALSASLIGFLVSLGTVSLTTVFWLFWILSGIGMRLGVNQLRGEHCDGTGNKRLEKFYQE
jgi:hypothetical protein